MKNILSRLVYTCLFVITILSCDNGETVPQQTITFTISSDTDKYWIALSDTTGKVLTWKAMANGVTETFQYTTETPVMLTMIIKSVSGDYTNTALRSYAAIQPGDYSYYTERQSDSGSPGTFVINRNSNEFNVQVQSEGGCINGVSYQDESRVDLSICDDNTSLLLLCTSNGINGDTPRYFYQPDIKKNGSLTLDMNLYNQLPVMKTKVLTFDKPFYYGGSLVLGNTIKKKKSLFVSAYYPSFNNSSQLKFYYPELIGSLFGSYTFIVFNYTSQYVYNNYVKDSSVPDASYPFLDVEFDFADSSKITKQSISTHVSGKADYTVVVFQSQSTQTESGIWFIYSPFTNEVSIKPPLFPDDLKLAAKLDLIDKMESSQISFEEEKGLGGYEGFYKWDLSANNKDVYSYSVDNRSKLYQLRPNVSTFGRIALPAYHKEYKNKCGNYSTNPNISLAHAFLPHILLLKDGERQIASQ